MCSVYMESDPVQPKTGVRRFMNLKKKIVIKPKPKRSNLGITWLNSNPKNRHINFFKCQNRTGGSLKKEEPHNTGHYLFTLLTTFFLGNFLGERNASKFPHNFFLLFLASKFPYFILFLA
jgi:hypothetical protein